MPDLSKWDELALSPEYGQYSPDQQAVIKSQWFKNEFGPTPEWQGLDDTQREAVLTGFMNYETPQPEKSIFAEGRDALTRGLDAVGESVGGTMEMAGIPGGKWVKDLYGERGSRKEIQRSAHLQGGTVVDHPERLADPRWWVNTIGENLPMMASMMAPGAAAYRGAKALGAGTKLATKVATGGAATGAFTVEAGSAYNDAKEEMIQMGYSEQEADSVATNEGLIVGTVNTFLEVAPFNILLKNPGGKKLFARLVRQALWEGGTEAVQENVNMLAAKLGHNPDVPMKDWIGRTIESGLAGTVLGGGVAAFSGSGQQMDTGETIQEPGAPKVVETPPQEPQAPQKPATLSDMPGEAIQSEIDALHAKYPRRKESPNQWDMPPEVEDRIQELGEEQDRRMTPQEIQRRKMRERREVADEYAGHYSGRGGKRDLKTWDGSASLRQLERDANEMAVLEQQMNPDDATERRMKRQAEAHIGPKTNVPIYKDGEPLAKSKAVEFHKDKAAIEQAANEDIKVFEDLEDQIHEDALNNKPMVSMPAAEKMLGRKISDDQYRQLNRSYKLGTKARSAGATPDSGPAKDVAIPPADHPSLAEAAPDKPKEQGPIKAIRIQEDNAEPDASKPQGLYLETSEGVLTEGMAGKKYKYNVTPQKPLLVDTEMMVQHDRGRGASFPASSGVKALRKLAGESEFADLLTDSKKELVDKLSKTHPSVEWKRYYDAYEILEGYAGVLAREKGYDAIVGDSDEIVVLDNSLIDRRKQPTDPGGAPQIEQAPPVKNGITQPERRITEGQRETTPNASTPLAKPAESDNIKTMTPEKGPGEIPTNQASDQSPKGGRAKTGGEIGVNGYLYKGGQFLPSTEMPPGFFRVGKKKIRAKKEKIESSKWEVQPSPHSRSIFGLIEGVVDWEHHRKTGSMRPHKKAVEHYGKTIRPGVRGLLSTEEYTAQELIDQYQKGARWIDVNPKETSPPEKVGKVRTPAQKSSPDPTKTDKIAAKAFDAFKNERGSSQLLTDVVNIFAKDQTQTANFKRWFKDSKVVDSEGKPLVVYHGTPSKPSESNNKYVRMSAETEGDHTYKEFDKFSTKSEGITDSQWFGQGAYFTPDPDYAYEFGDRIMPVYLSIQKPFAIWDDNSNSSKNNYRFLKSIQNLKGIPDSVKLDLSVPETKTAEGHSGENYTTYYKLNKSSDNTYSLLSSFKKDGGGIVEGSGKTKEEAIFNYRYKHDFGGFLLSIITKDIGAKKFREILEHNGYDGVVQYSDLFNEMSEIVAFEPTQIKSSIGNSGKFDPNNPSIAGSSQLITDIAEQAYNLIQSGVNTLSKFRREMRKAFLKVWDKIKHHMQDLFLAAKRMNAKIGQRGSIPIEGIGKPKKSKPVSKIEDDIALGGTLKKEAPKAQTVEQAKAEINRDIPKIIERVAVFLKNPKHTQKGKTDLSYFGDLLASIPSFFAEKIEATKKIFEASQNRQDDFHERIHWMENHDDVNVVESWAALKKSGDLKKATRYVVGNDRKGIGYRIEKMGTKWFVRDINRKNKAPLAEFRSSVTQDFVDTGEVAAVEKMVALEKAHLESRGFTPEQVKAVIAFRLSTNKGFDTLMMSMRRLIYAAEQADIKVPDVVTFAGGKKVTVDLKQAMAQMSDIRGFYFPRIRKPGKHVLRAFKDGEHNILETFTTRRMMNVRKYDLEKDGYRAETSPNEQMGEDVFQMAGGLVATQQIVNSALDRVETKLKNPGKEQIEGMQKDIEHIFASALAEQIANVIRERGSRVHMTSRSDSVYIGYEEDPEQVIAKYVRGISAGEAKRVMVMKMLKALTGTDVSWEEFKSQNKAANYDEYAALVKEKMIDQAKQPYAFKWAINYIGENTRNQEAADRALGIVKGVAVAKYLAFRVFSAPLVNLTALPTSTVASMKAAGVPYLKTFRLLSGGAKDYLKFRTGKGKLSKEQSRVFDHIRQKGWDNPQFNSEAMTTLRSALGRKYDKTIEYGMKTFSESERVNRAATIAATYKGLKSVTPSLGFDALMEKAKDVSDKSHGIYNKGNYPYIALGRHPAAHLTRMFYVFRTFSHTYLANMHRVGFKEKDFGALAHMAIAPAVIAGAGASVLTPIIGSILKAFGIDEPEEQAYLKIGEMFGPNSESFARFGATSLLPGGGFSIKGSLAIGIGDLPTKMTIKDFLGAPGSVIDEIFRMAPSSILRGDIAKGVEKALPTGFGNIIRAYRERSEGITTRNNAPVFYGDEQLKLSLVESIYRGFSFNPARIAGAREKQWKERKMDMKYREFRTDIYAKIKKYIFSGNKDKHRWAEIMGEILRYNEYALRKGLPQIRKSTIKANLRRSSRPSKRERNRG